MESWLRLPPKYTTFRINKLKTFELESLQTYLLEQSKELGVSTIPKFYFLKSDCLVIEQWPENLNLVSEGIEVIVDTLCAAAVLRGAHVYAPGVLGLPANCKIDQKVSIYGDLNGQCKRGLKIAFEDKVFVGVGYLKMLRQDLFDNGAQPNGIAIHTLLPASRLPVLNESVYPKGVILLQNLPSIVCGWVVNARPKEYVLDMCAAPGNKTTHLAEMSNNQAFITALDKTEQKVMRIQENCKIQGVTCVNAYSFDSTKCCMDDAIDIEQGPPYPPNSFDKVLLDAPCSGLGQRPQLRNTMSEKMLQSYKFLQRKLFTAAINILKINGKLVYSTCTTTVDENENMVAWVLEKFPNLKLIPAEPLLGGPGLPNCGLPDDKRIMVQRFGPEVDPLRPVEPIYRDTIGFFIAAFVKIS